MKWTLRRAQAARAEDLDKNGEHNAVEVETDDGGPSVYFGSFGAARAAALGAGASLVFAPVGPIEAREPKAAHEPRERSHRGVPSVVRLDLGGHLRLRLELERARPTLPSASLPELEPPAFVDAAALDLPPAGRVG